MPIFLQTIKNSEARQHNSVKVGRSAGSSWFAKKPSLPWRARDLKVPAGGKPGLRHFLQALGIPVAPELAKIIAATPTGDMTFLMTEWGKPFTANGFGNWFRDRCNDAGLPQCSAHGLRKAGATIAAERGATDRQLMAMFGWESARQATTYTAAADRKRLAADAARLVAGEDEPIAKATGRT